MYKSLFSHSLEGSVLIRDFKKSYEKNFITKNELLTKPIKYINYTNSKDNLCRLSLSSSVKDFARAPICGKGSARH